MLSIANLLVLLEASGYQILRGKHSAVRKELLKKNNNNN